MNDEMKRTIPHGEFEKSFGRPNSHAKIVTSGQFFKAIGTKCILVTNNASNLETTSGVIVLVFHGVHLEEDFPHGNRLVRKQWVVPGTKLRAFAIGDFDFAQETHFFLTRGGHFDEIDTRDVIFEKIRICRCTFLL